MRLVNLLLVFSLTCVGSCRVVQETKTKNIDSAQDKYGRYLNVKILKGKCLTSQGVDLLEFHSVAIDGKRYLQKDLTECTLDVSRKIGSDDRDYGRFNVDISNLISPVSSYFCGKDIAPHLTNKLDQVVICQAARNAIGNFLDALLATEFYQHTPSDNLSKKEKELAKKLTADAKRVKTIVEKCLQPAFISTDDIPANPAELVRKYPNNSECPATPPMRAWLTFIYAHINALIDRHSEFDQDPWLKEIDINYSTARHWYRPTYRDYHSSRFRKLFMYPGTLDNQGKSVRREFLEDKYLSESYELVRGFVKEVSGRSASPQSVVDVRKDIDPYLDAFSQPKHYYSRSHVSADDSVIFVVPLEDVRTLLRKLNTKISAELV